MGGSFVFELEFTEEELQAVVFDLFHSGLAIGGTFAWCNGSKYTPSPEYTWVKVDWPMP